ncbi:hypothetical protein BX616_006370 [Lobosporangium transversale]|nr:hypothetical protein BX616_006370 [Lobosporangium transversale]
MSPPFQGQYQYYQPQGSPMGPRPHMGPGGPNGMPSPGFRPMMNHGAPMMNQQRPPRPPNDHRMSMRRTNTMMVRPGPGGLPHGHPAGGMGNVVAAKEVLFKTRPCDVFQWRDDEWEPLVEDDDCYAELRLTTANRLAMAVTRYETGQLVLNAWIVESTTFRRASETDVSVSMDMGASVQWFMVALDTVREADEFCMAFQRTKERAMYDPSIQKASSSPVLSRGDSLASTPTQQTIQQNKPVRQTLTSMYPPADCKLLLQTGDHGQWMSLGAAKVEIKREHPSGYVRLFVGLISSQKRILDSVIVQCDCLELVGPKKLAITLMNPQEKMSIIYMLQFKDDALASKIFEGLSLNTNE